MLLLVLCVFNARGQSPDTTGMNSLIVYGDGFSFSVYEPDGWMGDTDSAASYGGSNIIFYPEGAGPGGDATLIQVSVFEKKDEKTEEDLAYDVAQYAEYAGLHTEKIALGHPEYQVFSKLVYVKGSFHAYIAYLNGGVRYESGLSTVMTVVGREATDAELDAFRQVIASLWLMGLK